MWINIYNFVASISVSKVFMFGVIVWATLFTILSVAYGFYQVERQHVNEVKIVSYNAPSTAYPGQTVSVQVTVEYSLNLTRLSVAISHELLNGSWQPVWYNPDNQTLRSGEGILSYSATFTTPSYPNTYRYLITAQYWNRSGWIITDTKYFTIQVQDNTPPTVRVISPNGGEKFYPGNVTRIRWEASDNVGVSKINIWLIQGDAQVMVISSDVPNTGYYNWTVPNRAGANYKIRIAAVDAAGNVAYDDSDGAFEIAALTYAAGRITSLTVDRNQSNIGETIRVSYTIRNTGNVSLDLRMVVEIVNPYGQLVYNSHQLNQDKRHFLNQGQSASGEFTWTIPADSVPGVYEVRASLRDWNVWDKIYDYRWGDRPGPRFIVVQGPTVEVRVSNVSLSVGGEGSSRIILSKAPTGLAGYELIVRLVPQAGVQQDVADIVDIRFPEWAGLTDKSIGDDQARFRAVDIVDRIGAGSEEIVLAEVVLRGKVEGTIQIELVVVMMDDDRGGNIPVTTRNGVLEVVRVLGPPSVEENLPPPRDLDGDGLYEDINGNGRLDYDDVVKFFRHFDDSVITQYSRYYDFNRNGRLDYDDIVELFKKV
jgi:PKD repeat protein